MAVRFSINQYWRVTLTPEGVKVLDERDAKLNAAIPFLDANWRKLYGADGDNRIEMQGWQVMNIFGPSTQLGRPMLIGTEIELIGNASGV